ncbi:MAG: hypothetical protein ABI587_16135 [Gemmatimonadales bacterium]
MKTLRLLAVLGLLALPAALSAQDSLPPTAPHDSAFGPIGRMPDTDSLGRPIIRYIVVSRSDVFDSTEVKGWIPRLVNGLHITTAEYVIRRELLLKVGEPYDSLQAAETLRNLRTVGVFRKVSLDTVTTDSGMVLRVGSKDGWTTQLDLRFRSAGNQTDWQVALNERNLLGTATRFSTKYRHTPDRNQLSFQFLQPRLVARTVALGLRYENRSDGERGSVAIERPFFSLSDKVGLKTLFDIRNERVLRFTGGFGTASDSLRRRYVLGSAELAKAIRRGSRGYLRIGVNGNVRRDDYAVWPTNTTTRSTTAAFGPFIEWRRANYVVTSGFARFGQDEDVDVSNFARLGLLAAPSFLGYDSSGAGIVAQLRVGTKLTRGFAWIDARANGLYNAGGLDSGSVTVGGTVVLTPASRHLVIGHADIGWIRNPLPATEFDLGFAIGPRAFPIHAFTGDRTYFATAEYRYIFGKDVFKALDLGLASFVDHGGAWYDGSKRRSGTDLGLGLRLAASRAADANVTRLDLAYRFKNDRVKSGWVFVVASGLVFNTSPRQ